MEQVVITLKPRDSNKETIVKSTSSTSITIPDVEFGSYDYTIVSDTYETVTGTISEGNQDVDVNVNLELIETIASINIADYGAVYNNPNHDNKALLHQAMDELVSANGGGTITFPSNGELYVSENIMMRENITFQGIGNKPTIKLMPNVSNFWSMIHMDTKKNMDINNLTIDSNKEARNSSGNLGDLSVQPQIIISMGNESENIDITNNKIVGNGVWLVACHTGGVHPKNIIVNNNDFFWSMGYSTVTPGKEFVNGVTVDNTWVYFDAIDYEFIGNNLNSDTPIANMTAIEAHGANGIVRDNTVRNARTGIIPWNMVNNEMSIANNILVEDNDFIDVLNGVDVGLSPTRNFKGLIIRRNNFHLKPSNFTGATFSRGIILGVWNAFNGEISEDFEIYENTITSENYQLPHTDSDAYYNYYGIGVGSGVYKNLTIRDNVINGVPSFGIMVQNEAFKTIDIQSGTIIGNTIKNSAKSLSNRGSVVVSAIHVASRVDTNTNGLTVDINDIIDERSTTDTWYKQPTTMPVAPRFREQNITESKLPLQTEVVYDSSVDGITFETSPNLSNIYVHTTHIRLTAGKQYVIETDIPYSGSRKNLFVSDTINSPLKASVGIGEVIDLPLSADGHTYVSARPLKDPNTQSLEPYNYTHFNDGTYKIIISENLGTPHIPETVWETRTRTETISFQTITVDKPDLLPSESRIEVVGKNGSRTYTWTVELVDGVETGNKTSEVETKYVAPINQIYWQGTREELFSDITFEFEYGDNVSGDAKIVHLGDSIIMGYGRTVTVPSIVESNLNKKVLNGGFGGTMANLHPNAEFAKISFVNLADSIASGDWSLQLNMNLPELGIAQRKAYTDGAIALSETDFNTVEAIIVSYGVNDWMDGTPIDGVDKFDKETYLGALRYGLAKIRTVYPHLKVLVTQPIFWSNANTGETSLTYRNGRGNLLSDFAESLTNTLAKDINVPISKTHYELGMNENNIDDYFYPHDGVHPNDAGNILLGNKIATDFNQLIDLDAPTPVPELSNVTFEFDDEAPEPQLSTVTYNFE